MCARNLMVGISVLVVTAPLTAAALVRTARAQESLVDLPLIANWTGAPSHASSVGISQNGKLLLSGHNGLIILWETQSSRVLASLQGHKGNVVGVAFLPGAQRVATADSKEIIIWEIPSGKKVASWAAPGGDIQRLAASPDGRRIATTSDDDSAVKVWDVASRKLVWTKKGLTGWVTGLAYSPDGKFIVTGQRGSVKLWNAATGSPITEISLTSQVWSVAVSPDNRFVAAAQHDGAYLVDLNLRRYTTKFVPPAGGDEPWFKDIAFHPNGRHIAAANVKGDTLIAGIAEQEFVAKSPDPKAEPQRIAISPDGTRAYIGRYYGEIQVLDLSPLR
jgi:WD40 repeat protein